MTGRCFGWMRLCVEILSPSSMKMDCERNVKLYCETGVREYWIVDSACTLNYPISLRCRR